MTDLKPGLKLKSAICDAEVMIIKAGSAGTLTCGGVPMLNGAEPSPGAEPDEAHMLGCQIGKRYITPDETVEVLCVKSGTGALAADGELLLEKSSKKLPSSD